MHSPEAMAQSDTHPSVVVVVVDVVVVVVVAVAGDGVVGRTPPG